jgi:hypothetical protein
MTSRRGPVEPQLNLVEPWGVRGREVETNAGSVLQELAYQRGVDRKSGRSAQAHSWV